VRRLVLSATDPGGTHAIYSPPRIARILDNPNLKSATLFSLCFPPDRAGLSGAVGYFRRVITQPGLVKHSFTFTAKAKANQEAATAQFKSPTGGTYAQLPSIQQPTLVADGRGDLVVPIANAHLLASTIPHARLIVHPNAGHAFLFQDLAQYGKAITHFLG
jgi:pimeloyl-ACP methyl ester carboxylesterase